MGNMVEILLGAAGSLILLGIGYILNEINKKFSKLFEIVAGEHGLIPRMAAIERTCDLNHSGAYDEYGKPHKRRESDNRVTVRA